MKTTTEHDTEIGEISIEWDVNYRHIPGYLDGPPELCYPEDDDFECLTSDQDIFDQVYGQILPKIRAVAKEMIAYRDDTRLLDHVRMQAGCDRP